MDVSPTRQMREPSRRRRLIFGAWISLVALLAFYDVYTGARRWVTSEELIQSNADLKWFYHAYFFLAGVCTVFHCAMLAAGLDLLEGGKGWRHLLKFLIRFHVLEILAVGAAWLAPGQIGASIGSASGVGSGSLMIYVFLVYPFLWFLFHPPAEDQTVDESLTNTPANPSLSHSHST